MTLSLESILKEDVPSLIDKTVVALQRGKLYRPLDNIYRSNSRSSRSTSTTYTTFPFVEDPVSGNSSECETWSAESERWEEEYGTVSSSDSELRVLLEKEARRTLEKNKKFLNCSNESCCSRRKGNSLQGIGKKESACYVGGYYVLRPQILVANQYLNKCSPMMTNMKECEEDKKKSSTEKEETGKAKKKNKGKKIGKGRSPSGVGNKNIRSQNTCEGKKQFPKARSKRQFEEDRYLPHTVRAEVDK